MSAIGAAGESVAISRDSPESVEHTLSAEEIGESISSIDALKIETISTKIIEKVLNNLGFVGKVFVEKQVRQKKGLAELPFPTTIPAVLENKPFLSNADTAKFFPAALLLVTTKISSAFSTSSNFMDSGLCFQISDCEPMGFVHDAAKQTGIDLTSDHIPSKYFVHFKGDLEQTREKAEVVFVLTEESEGIEFSKSTFTIAELQQEFNAKLQHFSHEKPLPELKF